MKVALITPKDILEWSRKGDMHFVVPENSAIGFFRNEPMYKMVDNGAYEYGKPLGDEYLLGMARVLKADEVVIPDVIGDKKVSLELLDKFINDFAKEFKYAAVPQGKDPLDWIDAYKQVAAYSEVDVICIPVWLQKRFGSRPAVVYKLIKDKKWCWEKKHHLIGLDGLGELYCYPPGVIRSVDTSLPYSRARAYLSIPFEDSTVSRLSLVEHNKYDFGLLQLNIDELLRVAHTYA